MAVLKYSRQREAILEFLKKRTDHPTADTVYENIREIYPNISLGTVYRNLSLLVDIGKLDKVAGAQGPDRYDARTAPHNHFICRNCHCVMDMEMVEDRDLETEASKNFSGLIENHTIHFYGICEKCMKMKKQVDKRAEE